MPQHSMLCTREALPAACRRSCIVSNLYCTITRRSLEGVHSQANILLCQYASRKHDAVQAQLRILGCKSCGRKGLPLNILDPPGSDDLLVYAHEWIAAISPLALVENGEDPL